MRRGFLLSNGVPPPGTLPAATGISTGSEAQRVSSVDTEAPGAVPTPQGVLPGSYTDATPDTTAVSWTATDTIWLTAVLIPAPGMLDLRVKGEVEEALQL